MLLVCNSLASVLTKILCQPTQKSSSGIQDHEMFLLSRFNLIRFDMFNVLI